MIRIDEIYTNTFGPYIEQNRPGTRVFFCDPPGQTDPSALFNMGRNHIEDNDYVFFHDQEPVDPDLYKPLFHTVTQRNQGLWQRSSDRKTYQPSPQPVPFGHVVVSEQGENVRAVCAEYGWTAHYYFYHGWACLDWFRGYDHAYLIARARLRNPQTTFMSPNRIVGGKRDHRVLFLYNVFKNNLQANYISAPRICPYEGVDIASIASKYNNTYPDIEQVFETADLPRLFAGEDTQLMHSYQLGNYKQAADSLIYVPTETVYAGQRLHLTEKTFKAIALEMPFVLVAPAHSLEYLRSYGFRTFEPYIDETYDTITDPILRIERVTHILLEIQARSAAAKNQLWQQLVPIVEHNYDHFYRGGFRDRLETELKSMLAGLCGNS